MVLVVELMVQHFSAKGMGKGIKTSPFSALYWNKDLAPVVDVDPASVFPHRIRWNRASASNMMCEQDRHLHCRIRSWYSWVSCKWESREGESLFSSVSHSHPSTGHPQGPGGCKQMRKPLLICVSTLHIILHFDLSQKAEKRYLIEIFVWENKSSGSVS